MQELDGAIAIEWRSGPPLAAEAPQVLAELMAQAARRAGGAVVLRAGDQQVTWEQLAAWSARLAGAWAAVLPRGGRLAIALPNGLPHLLAELAAWRLAAVAAPVFLGQGQEKVRAAIVRSRAVLVISDETQVIPAGLPHLNSAELFTLATSRGALAERHATAEEPCLLMATSGSTGTPRGVLLSQRNLCSQQAAFAALWPEVGPGDRLAAYLPWHHSFGGLAERLWSLCRGACLTVIPGGGRDQARFLACVRQVRPTVFMSVPKLHRTATLDAALDTSVLRWAFNAGAVLGPAEEAWYAERRIPVYEGWGLTETSPSATITPPGVARVPGQVGLPISGVSVGVRTDGRLFIAGPGVMLGYDGDAAATEKVLHHDARLGRVLDSGDVGAWAATGLRLEGRADQTVKLKNGEKVPLASVAARLEGQPGIRAAVVFSHEGEYLSAILAGFPGVSDAALTAAVAAANALENTGFLRVARAWRLTAEPAIDNGLLTASLKVARQAWLNAFATGAVRALVTPTP